MIYAVIDDNFEVWKTFNSEVNARAYLDIAHENCEKHNVLTTAVRLVEIPEPEGDD